jgi:hypothetical protein
MCVISSKLYYKIVYLLNNVFRVFVEQLMLNCLVHINIHVAFCKTHSVSYSFDFRDDLK